MSAPGTASDPHVEHFPFRIESRAGRFLRIFGVTPDRAEAAVDDALLDVRFGVFRVTTPLTNVTGVELTGPFRWYKALGPRMSLADRGATFGSSWSRGVCIRFAEPVAALYGSLIRHPGLTVTVEEPERLRDALQRRLAGD